jgi:hypothetical protein
MKERSHPLPTSDVVLLDFKWAGEAVQNMVSQRRAGLLYVPVTRTPSKDRQAMSVYW